MPTILDQLTLELGWDVKAFLESAKTVEKTVKTQREDFERHSKVWEATIGSLTRVVGGLAAAFLSLEALIKGIELSRGMSKAGTEFGNFADTVGMSVQQLSMWEQALGKVGGNASDVRSAFGTQKYQLNQGLVHGAPSTEFQGWMGSLGLDWHNYINANTKQMDLQRLNLDIADAIARSDKPDTWKSEALAGLGWTANSALQLFKGNVRQELEKTRPTAITEGNMAAFRRLNEAWETLGQTASKVGADFVETFEKPLTHILEFITKLSKDLDLSIKALKDAKYIGPFSETPTLSNPLGFPTTKNPNPQVFHGPQYEPSFSFSKPGKVIAPGTVEPAPPPDKPVTGGTFSEGLDILPGIGTGGIPTLPTPPPGSFLDRWMGVPATPTTSNTPERERSLREFELQRQLRHRYLSSLPKQSSVTEPGGSTSTTHNSSVTIGSMSFHGGGADAQPKAPSSIDRDLVHGKYCVHANECLE